MHLNAQLNTDRPYSLRDKKEEKFTSAKTTFAH